MKCFLLQNLFLAWTASAVSYKDSNGVEHTFPDNAKIVAGAMDVVALSHFGMKSDRVVATLGERSASGSNFGSYYYDGNIAFKDLNHGDKVYEPNLFPADPNEEERAFLDEIKGDLSEECSSSNYYCAEVDFSSLDKNGWPDIIVVGPAYSSLVREDSEFYGNATKNGVPIIVITKETYSEDGSQDYEDMVTSVGKYEELAKALGVHVPEKVELDKKEMCKAAETFIAATAVAHDNGVRMMASYMPYMNQPQGVTGGFIPNVDQCPKLALMQMLGAPIIKHEHSGSYWENRSGDYADGSGDFYANNTVSANEKVPYHVDFWLYDDRVTLDFLSPEFAAHWPHPALVAGQHTYWISSGRIFSYVNVAEYLTIAAGQLTKAKRVSTASECTPVDTKSMSPTRELATGQYSCRHVIPIPFCADLMSSESVSSEEESGKDASSEDESGKDASSEDESGKDASSDATTMKISHVIAIPLFAVTML